MLVKFFKSIKLTSQFTVILIGVFNILSIMGVYGRSLKLKGALSESVLGLVKTGGIPKTAVLGVMKKKLVYIMISVECVECCL